jgi:DNA-binding transcriptional LysR family regulator
MDRLEAMSILVTAVEEGSLSAAGRKLRIPLPTVSRNVSELEAHLNTSLLVRTRKGLQLTDAGRAFLAAAKAILENVTEAERAASGEYTAPTGDLVVTAPIVFGRHHLLPIVTEFLRAYPNVRLNLVQSDRVMHLIDDHVDIALRIGPLPDSGLTATRLGEVRQVLCASPAYLKERGRPRTPKDIARHICISNEGHGGRSAWRFRTGKADVTVPIHTRLSVNTSEAAIDAAISGSGLARVLSYQIAAPVRRGELDVVLKDYEPPPWPVHLVYNGQVRLPLKLRAFIDFTAPRLRQRLANATLRAR